MTHQCGKARRVAPDRYTCPTDQVTFDVVRHLPNNSKRSASNRIVVAAFWSRATRTNRHRLHGSLYCLFADRRHGFALGLDVSTSLHANDRATTSS